MHLVYITFPDKNSAIGLAEKLLSKNLIACANLYEGAISIYKWAGNVTQSKEFTLICKTSDKFVENVINQVEASHPYSCPCVVAVKVEKSAHIFHDWVESCCIGEIS